MKNVKGWLGKNWGVVLAVLASGLFVLFLFGFHLNSLTKGLSPVETSYVTQNSYIQNVVEQPVFLAHKLLTFVTGVPESVKFARLPSVLFALASVACFYALVARWYTRRVALLTTLLFVTSSWTLTIGRQALPTVMYLGWLPILSLLYWTISRNLHAVGMVLWALSFGLALYVPGLLWFVLVLGASQRKRLKNMVLTGKPWQLAGSGILLLLLIAPYIFAVINNPSTGLSSLGLPTNLVQITSLPERLYQIVLQLFIYSPTNPVFHLGHLPYIDITTTLLFLIGLYRLRYSPARKMMAWSGVISIGWVVGAGLGAINIAIFLPLIYMFAGGGISFLLVQWFKVFPRNPFARGFGVALMTGLVLVISFYHLNRYFIAWPLNPTTKAAFSGKIDR